MSETAPENSTDDTTEDVQATETEVTTEKKTVAYSEDDVKKLRQEAGGYRTKLRDAEKDRDIWKQKATEVEQSSENAVARATELERENAKLRVAIAKGLPANLVNRLVGDNEDELNADADSLLELFNRGGGNFDNGTRKTVDPPDLQTRIREAEAAGNFELSRSLKSQLAFEQMKATI